MEQLEAQKALQIDQIVQSRLDAPFVKKLDTDSDSDSNEALSVPTKRSDQGPKIELPDNQKNSENS